MKTNTIIKKQILWFDEDGVLICNSNLENEAETLKRITDNNYKVADYYVEDFGKLIQIVADLQGNSIDPFWEYKQLWKENYKDALGKHWTTPTGSYIPFFSGSQKEAISSIYWHIMNLLGLQKQAFYQWKNA